MYGCVLDIFVKTISGRCHKNHHNVSRPLPRCQLRLSQNNIILEEVADVMEYSFCNSSHMNRLHGCEDVVLFYMAHHRTT